MAGVASSGPGPSTVVPGAGRAVALLLGINLFNYIDRQVLSAVLPKLELDASMFRPDDPWLKSKLGLLTTAFLVTYMLAAPIFGRLGDRWSRWGLVGAGVILWSLATGGSGWATSFGMLLLMRCLVGIGEAAYGPVAPAMISDLYPERRRGKALSLFYLAIPVGSALGFVIGGTVADTSLGWRGAFEVVVIPGIVLGIICFFMRDPTKPLDSRNTVHPSWRATLGELRRIRSFVLCSTGMTCSTFVLGGVAAWAPYYIFEREARFEISNDAVTKLADKRASDGRPLIPEAVIAELRKEVEPGTELTLTETKARLTQTSISPEDREQYGSRIFDGLTSPTSITLGKINLIFGAIVVVAGLVATIVGSWLGDKLRDRYRGAYFLVCGYGALVAFPAFLGMLFMPFPWAWGCMIVTVFFLFINTGPANAILANVTHHRLRATAFAINILVIHLFGDAISPPLIGLIGDLVDMRTAMVCISLPILGAGILWTMGARSLDADTARATNHDGK